MYYMMHLYILVTCLIIATFIYWVYKVYFSLFHSPLKDIPGPFILQLFPHYDKFNIFSGKSFEVHDSYFKKYGPIVRLGWDRVIFCSEEAVKEIYSKSDYDKGHFYKILQEKGHDVFTTQDRDFHKKRKRILAPSYSQKSIEQLDPVIRSIGVEILSKKIKEHIGEGKQVDIFKLFCSLTLDVIGAVAFGRSFETLENGSHQVLTWIDNRIKGQILRLILPPLKYWFSDIDDLTKFAFKAIETAKTAENRVTIIDSMIRAKDPETGEGLSDRDLVDEATLQIFAGSDSMSSSMTWILYHLLKNPETMSKLNSEIETAFPNLDATIDLSSCQPNRLPYLDAVIKESMRVTPSAVQILERIVPKGGRIIDGYFIPEKTTVGVPIYSIHRSKELWGKDSEIFRPERWLIEKDGKLSVKSFKSKFVPFLVGSRACLGRHLAICEIQLTFTTLLRRFSFSLADNNVVLDPVAFPFLKPKGNSFLVQVEQKIT